MTSTSRLSRRIVVTSGVFVLLLVCCAWYTAACARLEASPLDKLRAWCGGDESPCACDKGCCNNRSCDTGCSGEEVDGEWFWVRSPEQEKRKVISLYNRYCIRCHGVDGRGVWDIPDVPDFTNERWQESRSDAQRARIILEGRGAVMPPFRGALTLEEAWAIGRYLHTFVPGTEVSRPDLHDADAHCQARWGDARSQETRADAQVVSPCRHDKPRRRFRRFPSPARWLVVRPFRSDIPGLPPRPTSCAVYLSITGCFSVAFVVLRSRLSPLISLDLAATVVNTWHIQQSQPRHSSNIPVQPINSTGAHPARGCRIFSWDYGRRRDGWGDRGMKRRLCGASVVLLASTGLALCLHSPAFAQPPQGPGAFAVEAPQAAATDPTAPMDLAPAPPLRGAAEPMALDFGENDHVRQWYASADYLLWWFKDSPLPVPLLTTTSNPNSTPVAAFNDPNTSVLLGNGDLNGGLHQGACFTAGGWIDDRRQIGLEGSYFFLADQTTVRSTASNGQPDAPVLAVPFFDEDAGAENTFVIAAPGRFAGAAAVSLSSKLQSAELQGVVQAFDANDLHVEVLAGGRFVQFTENLSFTTSSTGLSDPNTDLILNTVDQFGVRNDFYGWQVGTRAEARWGDFGVLRICEIGVGRNARGGESQRFRGHEFLQHPGRRPLHGCADADCARIGAFVQPSNQGRVSRDVIAVAPEVDVTLDYRLTDGLRVFAGYDFLYLSNVLRPGDQIDRGINFSQTVQNAIAGNAAATGTRPAAMLVGSDFWRRGFTWGWSCATEEEGRQAHFHACLNSARPFSRGLRNADSPFEPCERRTGACRRLSWHGSASRRERAGEQRLGAGRVAARHSGEGAGSRAAGPRPCWAGRGAWRI